MPWYAWLAIVVIAATILLVTAYVAVRSSWRGRRFLALSSRGKLRFGRLLLADARVPRAAKLTLLVLIGYLVLPFDIIPDFIPVVGQLDDLLAIIGVIALLLVIVPHDRFDAALTQAEPGEGPPA
jgi:uncharacterized membrane protein YkvA (DUF1232 family)